MILDIIQLVSAILLIIVILLQNKGTGIGAAFGGSGTIHQTRRGAEKGLFYLTIILSVVFLVISLTNLIW